MDLKEFFTENNEIALAFSGGVDSAYLLYAAKQYGAKVKAYYVKSQFQPEFEYKDAMRLIKKLDCDYEVINVNVLEDSNVVSNPCNRCYYCKRVIFENILKAASKDGFKVIIDGTNASDKVDDRPGMKALEELEVKSPLRLCGLTKSDVRVLSREAGLFTWDKPSYACLATRIQTGEVITEEKLKATEVCEDYLFSLGFTDFRIRCVGEDAKIQVSKDDIRQVVELRDEIRRVLKKYYKNVVLDLEVRPHE